MNITTIALVLVLSIFLHANLAIIFKMTNAVCESYNKSWVTFEQCRLRATQRDKVVLNMHLTFHHPTDKINLRLQVFKKANGYKPWIIDSTVDVCAFMRKPNEPVAKIYFDLIRNYSSVNHTCPYMGPQEVKDFYLRPELMLLPWPTGEYALYLTWIFSDKPQFSTNIYFVYEEDLIKQ